MPEQRVIKDILEHGRLLAVPEGHVLSLALVFFTIYILYSFKGRTIISAANTKHLRNPVAVVALIYLFTFIPLRLFLFYCHFMLYIYLLSNKE